MESEGNDQEFKNLAWLNLGLVLRGDPFRDRVLAVLVALCPGPLDVRIRGNTKIIQIVHVIIPRLLILCNSPEKIVNKMPIDLFANIQLRERNPSNVSQIAFGYKQIP